MVWHNLSVPKYSVLSWLVIKEKLLMRDRMIKFLINVSPTCTMCHTSAETHEHLFCNCNFIHKVWDCCPVQIRLSWVDFSDGEIVDSNLDSTRRKIAYLYVAQVFHATWSEWNFWENFLLVLLLSEMYLYSYCCIKR